jgi:hypothetical protein
MPASIYPKLYIRSKRDLAKHISHAGFTVEEALDLINDSLKNFDHYWKDSKSSEPEKEKYVRNASGKNLKKLHRKINSRVLAPHDKSVPLFIFGGLKGRNHIMAAEELLGRDRKRVLLKLDLKRFFEQVGSERVYQFFRYKCACDHRSAKIFAWLCCVPKGPKSSGEKIQTIARGFATSPRLAVWCNLNLFLKMKDLVRKRLKAYDPRIAVYVDDIGITASRIPKEAMEKLMLEIKELLETADPNQSLIINEKKTQVRSHQEGMEYTGIGLLRNRLVVGRKARSKKEKVKNLLKEDLSTEERKKLTNQQNAMNHYKHYVEKT